MEAVSSLLVLLVLWFILTISHQNKLKKKNSSKKTLLESPGFQVMCTTSVFHDVLFASGSLLYCAKDVVPYKLLATTTYTHKKNE